MSTNSRKSYSITKKLEVIKAYKNEFNFNATHTADFFKIDRTLIKKWYNKKDEFKDCRRSCKKIIKNHIVTYPNLEDKLFQWIKNQREKKDAS